MESKSRIAFSVICLSSVFLASPLAATAATKPKPYTGKGISPAYLRCEYLVDPLGIGEPAPRLSWIVESGERGQRQTAYRLLVASSEKLLAPGPGRPLGHRQDSPATKPSAPSIGAQPLASHQRCFWKVKVWDKDGRESAWSKPAMWSMGLLQPDDWKADWIGYDKPRQTAACRRLRSIRPSGFGTRRMSRAMCPSASASFTTPSPCRQTRRSSKPSSAPPPTTR